MPKAHATWTVLPHGPIEKPTERVWRIEGSLPGFPMKRVMTVIRREDGGLVIHNGIALDDAAMREIDAWGKVAMIIVPNAFHRLDAKVFRDRYPHAQVVCPGGARKKVEDVVPVTTTYEKVPKDSVLELVPLDGTKQREGVLIVREPGGTTLVFNDSVFNMPHQHGVQGFVLRHVTKSSGGPGVTRIVKLFVIDDRPAFKAHLTRLAELPNLQRIIVSHHETITRDPAGTLRGVAASL